MRRLVVPLSAVLLCTLCVRKDSAQPPEMASPSAAATAGGGLNNVIQAVPADINAAYALPPEAGPWLICAASYQNESAAELAYLLCTYLRQKGQPAYVFNRGNEERRKAQDELDKRQKAFPGMARRRILAHPQEDQLAILIGGFKDADAAHAALNKVHHWPLPDIKLRSGKPAFDIFEIYEPDSHGGKPTLKRYGINPFHNAFVIPNPLIRREKQTVTIDPLWKQLNAGEPRSLYKCKKPWTLAVQEFRGNQVIQTTNDSGAGGLLAKMGLGDNFGKRLDYSAKMAQQVCDLFKKLGFKSYVLHTRYNSVVTVGEFDSPNDPQLLHVQEQLARLSFRNGKTGETAFNLFHKAMPMEVPH